MEKCKTHEEAIVYVKELDIFLTMKVLENTPAVLSPGKLCYEKGFSYEWINCQKPHLIKKTGFGLFVTRRNSFQSWLDACQRVRVLDLTHQLRGHFQDRGVIAKHFLPARLHHLQ